MPPSRVLSFDMQTSTTDLLKEKEFTKLPIAQLSAGKLGVIGKGLSKATGNSIQDILDSLPSMQQSDITCQTGNSLWGIDKLPLFDASVRTNEELVTAAAVPDHPLLTAAGE